MGENPLASLSPLQIKQLQRVFYSLDKDMDGRVSEAHVAEVLRHLGASAPLTQGPQTPRPRRARALRMRLRRWR